MTSIFSNKKNHVLSCHLYKLGLSLIVIALLNGCSSAYVSRDPAPSWMTHQAQISALKTWQASGVVGIKGPGVSSTIYVNLIEKQNNMMYLRLLGSLGTPSAKIAGSRKSFTLKTSDGKTYRGSDPDALAKQILGYPLPVAGLRYWIVGIPAPGTHEQALSPQNLLLTLKQDGWQIDYINYQPVGLYTLPAELTLKRGDLSVRILVKEWTL